MMHAPVGRTRAFQLQPRDEVNHFVMSDFALGSSDHSMQLQGRGKSRIYPAGYPANPGHVVQQGGGTRKDSAVYGDSRTADVLESYGEGHFCAQTHKNDVAAAMSAEGTPFSADEYTGVSNVSEPNTTLPTQDEHRNKGDDLFLFDWPDLGPLEGFETDRLRKLDSTFEIGSNYFDDPMWPSICSPDAQLVPSSHFDNDHNSSTVANEPILQSTAPVPDTTTVQEINMSNPISAQQQLPKDKGGETPLMDCSSSGEFEHFPPLPDADLFFCPFDDMLVPTPSRTMYRSNDEIMSSPTATLSGPDIIPRGSARKKPHATTPDMVLDEMAGNPLEMYFPPLETYEQPGAPMSGAPHGYFAGNGAAALSSSGLEFGPKGRRAPGGGSRENPRSSKTVKAAPPRHAGFQKLQEGMNQLDVGAKTCIRDALYRLANNVELRHCGDKTTGSSSSGAANRSRSSVWSETQGSPMDRSVAQLLLQKPLHRKAPDRQANRVAS